MRTAIVIATTAKGSTEVIAGPTTTIEARDIVRGLRDGGSKKYIAAEYWTSSNGRARRIKIAPQAKA